jgi:hypothetical protein
MRAKAPRYTINLLQFLRSCPHQTSSIVKARKIFEFAGIGL